MRENGIAAKTKRKFKHTTDSKHKLPVADNHEVLEAYGMKCSMSRKGNCWDNAVMESFYRSIKTELIYHEDFGTREEARRAIFEYIEVFYNRVRRHSTLGYLSPTEYESRSSAERLTQGRRLSKVNIVRSEDRALLRSNPSADRDPVDRCAACAGIPATPPLSPNPTPGTGPKRKTFRGSGGCPQKIQPSDRCT